MMDKNTLSLEEGRITGLVVQSKHPDRISVFIEGEYAFGIHQDLVLEYELRKGKSLTVDEQRRVIKKDQILRAKSTALRYLAYRARSEDEVRRKLLGKGFDEVACEQAIERLRELGYIDDAEYALNYARNRFEHGNYGPNRIRFDLIKSGIDQETIEVTLKSVFKDEEEIKDSAREQAARRWVLLSRESDLYKRRKKLYNFLYRRGFSYDVIQEIIHEIAGSEDDFDSK